MTNYLVNVCICVCLKSQRLYLCLLIWPMFVFTFVHLVNVCIHVCSFCKETSQQALGGGLPEDAEESAKSDVSPTQRCQTLTIAPEHLKRNVSQQSVSNFSWSQKKKTTLFWQKDLNLFLKILFNFLSSSFFPIFFLIFFFKSCL